MNIKKAHLYDSDTTEMLTADDLGISQEEYAESVAESAAESTPEGHIYVGERRVYAAD